MCVCVCVCVCMLPWWLSGKESASNAGDAGEGFSRWVWKIPWRRAW